MRADSFSNPLKSWRQEFAIDNKRLGGNIMKKILALVLALVLALGVGAVSTASADDAPYEIVWRRYGTADQTGVAAVQEQVNKWLSDNGYNFTVDMSQVRDGDTIQIQLAAKEHIDIFWSNASDLTNTLQAGGFLYDIGGIYKDYEGLYNSIPENIWGALLRNGGASLYQIPCYKEAGLATSIVIKKSDADKFGWTDIIANDPTRIWTFADLKPYLEEAAATGEYEYLINLLAFTSLCNGSREYAGMDQYAAITDFIAIDLEGDTTKAVKITDIPAYQEMVKTLVEYNEAGYISEDFITNNGTDEKTWLFHGETLTPDMQNNMDNRYSKFDENGVYYMNMSDTYLTSTSALGSAYSIASYTENVDACMKFFDVLYSNSELADLCLYGIEGVNYKRLDDGSCENIKDTGYDFATWATSNVMTVSLENTDSKDKKEQYAAFNASAKDSILMGFVFDRSKVEAEYAACNAVKAEYQKQVEWGFMGEEGLQEYSDALDGAGVQAVLDEMNAQLAEFFAAK